MAKEKVPLPRQGLQLGIYLLITLWVYAAVSKGLDPVHFRQQLYKQVLPQPLVPLLSWAVPAGELLTAILLCFPSGQRLGLRLSLAALLGFTVYTGLILVKVFGRVPCACGGLLEHLSWPAHLAFNLAFLTLTAFCVYWERLNKQQNAVPT